MNPAPSLGRVAVFYAGAAVLAMVVVGGVLTVGATAVATGPAQGFGQGTQEALLTPLARTLLALATIMATSQLLGRLFQFIGQPPVMGEVVGGILLGPTLLGWLSPAAYHFLLPAEVVPSLNTVAKIGVILYMFFVGLELDTGMVRNQGSSTVVISHVGIVVPFSMGALLALYLYPGAAPADVPFHVFALFIGVSMAITAFPVLARILTDQKMHQGRLGTLALTCAAVGDLTAWCVLAAVVAVATARPMALLVTLALVGAYVVLMALGVRPLLRRVIDVCEVRQEVGMGPLGLVMILAVLSACATESMGIHALFGAFFLGALVPHDSLLARELTKSLWNLVSVLFLPAFFAFTGMRTQIGLVSTPTDWLTVLAICAVASVGKFGGTYAAARWSGYGNKESTALGILMNTRGLMELIVLSLGLDLKILTPQLFTMFVLMALVTTFATTPLVRWMRAHEME